MRRLFVVPFTVIATALFTALFAAPAPAFADGGHAAITVTSNADFSTCSCVTSGNGTEASPFVIGPFSIPAPSGGTSGWSVKIDNSKGKITDFFNISGISSTYNDTNPSDPTIWLINVHTATAISGSAGNNLGIGIELDNSSNISIDNVSYNKGNGIGAFVNGSSNVSINNSKFKATCTLCSPHVGDGIYAVNSSNLQIGTGADCPNSIPCVDVTYDSGFGVYLQNTHDVVINNISADSDDTGGFVLDGSDTYNVAIKNSHASAAGPICITFNGQKVNTGYFSDLQGGLHLINGAHDNTITNDTFTADTGIDIASGGNGFYVNACTGVNQPFSPVEPAMGSGNTFSNICYMTTNIAGLPPANCKS